MTSPFNKLLEAERVYALAVEDVRRFEFHQGICIGLQVMYSSGHVTAWKELIDATGGEIIYHAAHVEPGEWELAGFKAWSKLVLGCNKPKKRARA